jgi:ketosteroid isomerase-like protein
MTNTNLADALFAAFENADADAVRSLCAPDFRGQQNLGPSMGLESLIRFSLAVSGVVPDFRYEDRVVTATDKGFVEEHMVCGSLPDGSALRLPACVVAEVKDGRIVSLREYLDTAAAAGLLKALR